MGQTFNIHEGRGTVPEWKEYVCVGRGGGRFTGMPTTY